MAEAIGLSQVDLVTQILIFATFLAGIVGALVEVSKQTFNYPKNYVPLVALVLGGLVGFAAAPFTDLDVGLRLWAGCLAGLSATGLFELVSKRDGQTKE
ncbi:holin [Paenalkalicoccus suaedae]|uniref:Holin n=1 Tax=Paenalkalicoccus suaedae TaxID=2592382 RepID=A0A859FGL8_9BACI|nr:holin [Paenalkalicoccus suaedae]QKS71958.1 holin [Paenalkalicoccus suaedae]